MKKRLKKKKHVYPYSIYGVELDAEWIAEQSFIFKNQKEADEYNNKLFSLIDKMEELGLDCGGGSNNKTIGFFINSHDDKERLPTLNKLEEMKKWMEATGWFKNIKISEYKDAWYPDRELHEGDKKFLKERMPE